MSITTAYTASLFDGADCSETEVECENLAAAIKECRRFLAKGIRPKASVLITEIDKDGQQVGEYWLEVDLYEDGQIILDEDFSGAEASS